MNYLQGVDSAGNPIQFIPTEINIPWMNSDKGWICPKCDRVYSPHIDTCGICNGTELDIGQPWLKKTEISHESSNSGQPDSNNKSWQVY